MDAINNCKCQGILLQGEKEITPFRMGSKLFRKIIMCVCLAMVLPGLLACSAKSAKPTELTEDEVKALIQNDMRIILNHLDSVAKTQYGKNYLADLLEKDLDMRFDLEWAENGKVAGKGLGTNREAYRYVTREQIDKALFHKVTLSENLSSGTGFGLGHWYIYPDGKILPSPNALRLEAELAK